MFKDVILGDGSAAADSVTGQISPDDVRRLLSSIDLTTTPVIVLDEFDKLTDSQAKSLVANTIKSLSDYSVPATVILVGVARSVSELLMDHESIGRAMRQVPMPRMDTLELAEILDKRLPKVGMKITADAKAQIIALSRGLPHYTHLLGLHAARRSLREKLLLVNEMHVDEAEKDCLQRVHHSIREQYHRATHSPRSGNIYKEVVLACALAEPDELGFFPAKAVERPLSTIMDEEYKVSKFGQHLKNLCENDRGKILEVTGSARRFRYRFVEPLMQPFVIMTGLADGKITKQLMRTLAGEIEVAEALE